METTQTDNSSEVISVFFQDILKKIWKDGNRPWDVYTTEQYRYFWDTRTVEHRS